MSTHLDLEVVPAPFVKRSGGNSYTEIAPTSILRTTDPLTAKRSCILLSAASSLSTLYTSKARPQRDSDDGISRIPRPHVPYSSRTISPNLQSDDSPQKPLSQRLHKRRLGLSTFTGIQSAASMARTDPLERPLSPAEFISIQWSEQ